jgi:16S rRNA processing protein RimM
MSRPEWIEVGRISRPHGVHGEVRVALSSDNPERFAPGVTLHARPGRRGVAGARLPEQVRLTIESVRGDDGFPIVAFAEISDRDKAEAFCGYLLEVGATELPELEEGEFYPFDLIGLEARDPSGAVLGRVTDALDSPAHAILVIALIAGGEALVPFVMAAVPTVEVEGGFLVIDTEFASVAPAPVRVAAKRARKPEAEPAAPDGAE